MTNSFRQFKTVFDNVFLLGWRGKQIHAEMVFPLIVGIVIMLKNMIPGLLFLAPVIISLAINSPVRQLLIRLVEEKHGRHKETQKIMGLKQGPYFAAWYLSGLVRTAIGALFFLVIPVVLSTRIGSDDSTHLGAARDYLGIWELIHNGSLIPFIILYALYVLASVNQAFFLSTFFSKPKLAGEVGTFIITLTALGSFLIFNGDIRKSTTDLVLIGMSPQATMGLGYVVVTKSDIYQLLTFQKYYSMKFAIIQMAVMCVVYFVLYFYFEAVMPNEYGIQKHPLFCLKRKEKQNLTGENDLTETFLKENEAKDFSSALYHEDFGIQLQRMVKSVEIQNVVKQFGKHRAVDSISINLYEKNILCLLGHNGAGKTTLISLLTGLIKKSGGDIYFNGLDINKELDKIRNSIGICTQYDVVYDDLTLEEHLAFMANIKGVPRNRVKAEVEKLIQKTRTQPHRKKLVKNLSGGNKRKLSLAMALVGGSKIVFLDEPTSGMDPISRRSIWKILESIREEERSILLTTHHLDEAEVLADRIAVMAKGQLLAVGTTDYIKQNFGVGYHLTVSKQYTEDKKDKEKINNLDDKDDEKEKNKLTEEDKTKVEMIVKRYIPQSVLNPQANVSVIQFIIPFDQQSKLGDLFKELENQGNLNMNLEMNSLEDAFINIGMDEKKFLKDQNQNNDNLDQKNDEQENKSQLIELNNNKSNINDLNNNNFFTNFDDIEKPDCLATAPVYRFWSQTMAIFIRKYFCTIRVFSSYVAFVLPLALLLSGAFMIETAKENLPDNAQLSAFSLFATLAYALNGGIYILLPVQEREHNLKYALNVMGCRPSSYWLGTFLFDFTVFVSSQTILFVGCLIGNLTYITQDFGKLLAVFAAFGFSFLPFSYLCGFMYKKAYSALKVFPLFNFFVVYLVPFIFIGGAAIAYSFSLINVQVWKTISMPLNILASVFSPFYTMQWGIAVIAGVINFDKYDSDKNVNDYYFVMTYDYWKYVIILIMQGLVYGLFTYELEQKRYNIRNNHIKKNIEELKKEVNNPKIIDNQRVIDEAQRIKKLYIDSDSDKNSRDSTDIEQSVNSNDNSDNLEQQRDDQIIIKNLWKQYDNGFVALKGVSYGIKKGEIFGLLGPNGAGKSTSFNLLSSMVHKTLGEVTIKNQVADQGMMDLYQDVGICPQFDCLWPSLNPREHLYLFGRMKGLKGKDLDQSVDYFIKVMQLDAFVKTKAGNLSGGNKRKLGVCNALIGGPDIQFFDEPSTGVDPIARRYLWNTLKQGQTLRDSSIVLTTHTMEEAESLCNRIGILINGQFYCLGSPAELRNQFGDGYTIRIKGSEHNKDQVLNNIQQVFPSAQDLEDKSEGYYNIKVSASEFVFSKTFYTCEKLKEEQLIHEFSISSCSLEDVFLSFSKYQIIQNEDDELDEDVMSDEATNNVNIDYLSDNTNNNINNNNNDQQQQQLLYLQNA